MARRYIETFVPALASTVAFVASKGPEIVLGNDRIPQLKSPEKSRLKSVRVLPQRSDLKLQGSLFLLGLGAPLLWLSTRRSLLKSQPVRPEGDFPYH